MCSGFPDRYIALFVAQSMESYLEGGGAMVIVTMKLEDRVYDSRDGDVNILLTSKKLLK